MTQSGTTGLDIPILKMRNKLLVVVLLVFFIGSVSAYQYKTLYNSFTGKLDYFQTENYTGHTLYADRLIVNGSVVTGNLTRSLADTLYVFKAGDNMTGDLGLGGNRLTNVGNLVMGGIISSQNIIPALNSIYNLGNSSNRFDELYINKIYAVNISTTYLNSSDIDSTKADIGKNLTVDGYEIREENSWLIFKLK